MGVSRAKNGDKTKDISMHAKPLAVGLDHAFAGHLRGAVKQSLDGKRAIFGGRYGLRFSVNRAGRGETHLADADAANRFQYMERRSRVLFNVLARMLNAEADISIGCEVEDKVAASHSARESRLIEIIAFNQGKSRMLFGVLKEFGPASRIVIPADYGLAARQ